MFLTPHVPQLQVIWMGTFWILGNTLPTGAQNVQQQGTLSSGQISPCAYQKVPQYAIIVEC